MARNAVCHIEIGTKNAQKAAKFYQDLFGWKTESPMGDEYIFFVPESGPGGAISQEPDFVPGKSVTFYTEVDDIEATIKRVIDLGGQEIRPKTEIPSHGWYGLFSDLDGNQMGLFTPKK